MIRFRGYCMLKVSSPPEDNPFHAKQFSFENCRLGICNDVIRHAFLKTSTPCQHSLFRLVLLWHEKVSSPPCFSYFPLVKIIFSTNFTRPLSDIRTSQRNLVDPGVNAPCLWGNCFEGNVVIAPYFSDRCQALPKKYLYVIPFDFILLYLTLIKRLTICVQT